MPILIFCKHKMMHVFPPYLLSLLLICFFVGTTAKITTSISHNGGVASRKDITTLSYAKVTPMIITSTSTNKRNKHEGETISWMINRTRKLNQVNMEVVETTPNNKKSSTKNNVVVTKCDDVSSSKSVSSSVKEGSSNEKCQKLGRKLIPRKQDMDTFVAYADYRGPQRHPPRNN
ncbi:uncharacterized protein LOC110685639 [Chenopodium quinoa]|uniref:uncharacterized protein LOC110685639 n=1 Tax=Chenopodium quinoa TaxID=63459 RepID=UPI000B78D6D6|nr:uncharacterized protein LOC110685639 [Chenopodium quinoa]